MELGKFFIIALVAVWGLHSSNARILQGFEIEKLTSKIQPVGRTIPKEVGTIGEPAETKTSSEVDSTESAIDTTLFTEESGSTEEPIGSTTPEEVDSTLGPIETTTPDDITTTKRPPRKPGVIVRGDCFLDVADDLEGSVPLLTQQGGTEWILPNSSGIVEIKNGKWLDLHCSDSFKAPFLNRTIISARCLQGQYFLVDSLIYPFKDFNCTDWPTYTARRTNRSCNGGTDLLEVGFEVSTGFLQIMDICHDEVNEVTRYVHHVLYPASAAYQHGVSRPRFVEGDFYGSKNVDTLYTQKQQNITVSEILGMDASPYFDTPNNVYMARGHMAAKVDFIYGAQQKATFFFVNAAPQWQTFNGGNWERVEDGVRKYVGNHSLTVDCYTGIWGISTLPDVNGLPQELYLDFDENNNGLIPAPKIYFRVVIERETRKGIVLVGVNNPHAPLEEVLSDYVICDDIGDGIDWIDWSKTNLTRGYMYACSVPDFAAVVKDLPEDVHNVTGILGIDEEVEEIILLPGSVEQPPHKVGEVLSVQQPGYF